MNISISRDGIEIGEWTEEEVKAFYLEGRLVDEDLFWMPGMSEWLELRTLIRPALPFPDPVAPLRSPVRSAESHNIPPEAQPRLPLPSICLPAKESDWSWFSSGEQRASVPPPPQNPVAAKIYPGIERIPFLIYYAMIVGVFCFTRQGNVGDEGIYPAATAIGLFLLSGVVIYLRLINIGNSNWVLQLLVAMIPCIGWIVLFNCLFSAPGSGPVSEQKARDRKRKRLAS